MARQGVERGIPYNIVIVSGGQEQVIYLMPAHI